MAEVTIKKTTSALLSALVDDKTVRFNGDGVAVVKAAAGQHSLTWVVRGQPGAKYTIEITDPQQLKFSHSATLDVSMRDGGLHWFTV